MRFQILHIMIVNRVYHTHHVYKYIGTIPIMKYNVSCTCMLVSHQIYPNCTNESVMSHVLVRSGNSGWMLFFLVELISWFHHSFAKLLIIEHLTTFNNQHQFLTWINIQTYPILHTMKLFIEYRMDSSQPVPLLVYLNISLITLKDSPATTSWGATHRCHGGSSWISWRKKQRKSPSYARSGAG